MASKKNDEDMEVDGDSDYEPEKPVTPPRKRRRTIRACRKRGQPKKTEDVEVEIEFPEEVDGKNFSAEVIDENLGFDSVGGLEETIVILKRRIILPIENKKIMEKKFSFQPPKGVIFHGPPGTGKTLLAKALAAELSRIGKNKFKFYYRKGSDLLSKYVGESETNVKLIFDVAKANKPAIVFFDQLDAICSRRNDQSGSHHETSLVCTILAQMDCITSGDVLVIGATNRLDSIDPAFRRQGCFDTEVSFSSPDHKGRNEILKVHFRNWEKVSQPNEKLLEELVTRTAGYTGADLQGLCLDAMNCAIDRTLALPDGKPIRKQLEDSKILATDWYKALLEKGPTNTNVFGNQNFAGIQIDPSLKPMIGGIKNEINEWIQKSWSPEITGFTFAVIWSEFKNYVSEIDNIIVPAALTELTGKNKKIIVIRDDKLEPSEMIKILDETENSSLSTLIYFPRVDIMDENLKTVLVRFLEKQELRRLGKPALFVIGSCGLGINDLDKSLTKLLAIPPVTFEVRHPYDNEVKNFFTPALKIHGKHFQKSMRHIVQAARDLNVTTLSTMKTAISRQGANIEAIIKDYSRLFGHDNDSDEEGFENEEDSNDESDESDSGTEQ